MQPKSKHNLHNAGNGLLKRQITNVASWLIPSGSTGQSKLNENTMHWKFWQQPVSRELPLPVKTTVMSQFDLASQSVDLMRYSEQPGRFGGKKVRRIRIFDPATFSSGPTAIARYHQFQLAGDRTALLFEGRIDLDGQVVLFDRR